MQLQTRMGGPAGNGLDGQWMVVYKQVTATESGDMLDLVRTFTGSPAGPLQHLVLPHATLIVRASFCPPDPTLHSPLQLYSSADTVVVLNAASLQLIRVLAFQEVFPGLQSLSERVSCVAVDPAMKIVRQLVA